MYSKEQHKQIYSKIKQLDHNKLLVLSSNPYYLNIIQDDSVTYRIDTQDSILYFAPLCSSLFIDKSTLPIHFFIIIDRKLHWNIYIHINNQTPQSLFFGHLSSSHKSFEIDQNKYQSMESNKYCVNNCSVVNVHQMKTKLIFILDNFQICELLINSKHKQLAQSFVNKKSQSTPMRIKSEIIYPLSSSPYLTNFYLPSPSINTLIDSLLVPFPNLPKQNQNQQTYHLYFVLRSKTKRLKGNDSHQTYSIYQSIFHPQQRILLSGKSSVFNIQNKYLGIYFLNEKDQQVIIQTDEQIYLWQLNCQIQSVSYQNLKFTNPFTAVKKSETLTLVSVVKLDSNDKKRLYKLIEINFKKDKGLNFQQLNQFQGSKEEPLLFFQNSNHFQQSYIFYSDYSIAKVKNTLNQDSLPSIFSDHSVTVEKTQFVNLEPSTNILFLQKKNVFSQNTLIITNSFIETEHNQYKHNLPIKLSKVLHVSSKQKQTRIFFSSPLIGTLALSVSKGNSNDLIIKSIQDFKFISGYQTLAASQSLKSFVNGHQILFDFETSKSGKLPSVSIAKIFESSTDFVEKGVILEKSGLYLLSLQDQLHVFEGNNEKSFKRKFIHCFKSHIKQIFKLNDVNVIGVELYQNHLQNNLENEAEMSESGIFTFEVYLIKQDKIFLMKKVKYGHQWSNKNPLSLLTHINTVAHYLTFVYDKVILVPSQQTHRYNPQKVRIQVYDFPSPLSEFIKIQVVPLVNLSVQNRNNSENQFLLLLEQNRNSTSKIFIGSFPRKLLIKNMQEIKFNYESVISCIDFKKQRVLFSTVDCADQQNSRSKRLMVWTQKNCYNLKLRNGKIQLSSISLTTQKHIDFLLKLNTSNQINQYRGLQKIQGPVTLIQKQVNDSKLTQDISYNKKYTQNLQSSQILLVNKFEVWYCVKNKTQKIIKPISVYAMVNNDFLEFRNNLSVDQLEQPQFIRLFSQKLPIHQVKYLSNNSIIVLFERQITILQIGQNGSLNVKQQIPFSKIKNSHSSNSDHEQKQSQNQNQYSSIKIIQLLEKCSETDIFLKDAQSRLYILQFNCKNSLYSIKFDRNLQQDIVSIIRTNFWDQNKISVPLLKNQSINQIAKTQEIVIKKDSQLIIKDLISGKQKSQYV